MRPDRVGYRSRSSRAAASTRRAAATAWPASAPARGRSADRLEGGNGEEGEGDGLPPGPCRAASSTAKIAAWPQRARAAAPATAMRRDSWR